MLHATILYEEIETKTICLTVYENGIVQYGHLTDNDSTVIELLQKYQIKIVDVEGLVDTLLQIIDVELLVEKMIEHGINVTTNIVLRSDAKVNDCKRDDLNELLNNAMEEYVIVIDDNDNSHLLISSFLENGYIISCKRLHGKIHLKVHGATMPV